MNSIESKKVTVIYRYAVETFSEGDWYTLGQLTGTLELIQGHIRLLRALSFEDEDYDSCVAEVISKVCEENPERINLIIDHFDIELWYEQKDPAKFKKIFEKSIYVNPDFWLKGNLKAFISHLAVSKKKIGNLKRKLELWGISSFVAHEDIEPSREWMLEIEKALATMDILIAVIEPKFSESNWTDQEIGFALGRNIDIIPLRVGADPYGFMGKYQGIQAKEKYPEIISQDIVKVLLKKPRHRDNLILSISKSIKDQNSSSKIEKVELLVSWNLLTDEQIVNLVEGVSLTENEKKKLGDIIQKYGAFPLAKIEDDFNNDIPF